MNKAQAIQARYERNGRSALRTARFTVPLPAHMDGGSVRIAFLSDLHNGGYHFSLGTLVKAICKAAPDMIVSGGDLLTAKGGICHDDAAVKLVRYLVARFPVYLTDGNHETRLMAYPEVYSDAYLRYREALAGTGAVYLVNETARVQCGPITLTITGFVQPITDYNRVHPHRVNAEEIKERTGPSDAPRLCGGQQPEPTCKDAYHILLAHDPASFEGYADWGAHLTLSGHLHGGMFRLPLLGGLVGDGLRPFPRYDRGMFVRDGKRLIVSAGLGAHSIPIRINNPPELVIIDLQGHRQV